MPLKSSKGRISNEFVPGPPPPPKKKLKKKIVMISKYLHRFDILGSN